MAIRSVIARLEHAGWRITQHGGPRRTPGGRGHVSWVAAWARPWTSDLDAQVHIEVNCPGTPEAALSRLLHLAEIIANDETSATSARRELEEAAALPPRQEVSLAPAVGARTDLNQYPPQQDRSASGPSRAGVKAAESVK